MVNIKSYEWIKQESNGVLGIYPRKCLNSYIFNSVLLQLQKEYKLYKIFNDYIRAIKINE